MDARYRTIAVAVFAVVQVALLATVLVYYGIHQDVAKVDLETHELEEKAPDLTPLNDSLNTVSFFTGPEYESLDFATRERQYLSFCPGQMMWFLLGRPTANSVGQTPGQTPLYDESEWHNNLPLSCRDGVVNFLYDVGADPQLTYYNWNSTAVRELQASPLLPWQKHLDFVVLSSLENDSAGGLTFITNINPDMLLVTPKLDEQKLQTMGKLKGKPNALQLDEGLHKLLPGLWALVLPTPEQFASAYELDLLMEKRDGSILLFVGSGLNEPGEHLRRAEMALGRPVSRYIGATGWNRDDDMLNVESSFTAINERYPRLQWQPNAGTSMVVRGLLETTLGDRYHSARLGSRIRCE